MQGVKKIIKAHNVWFLLLYNVVCFHPHKLQQANPTTFCVKPRSQQVTEIPSWNPQELIEVTAAYFLVPSVTQISTIKNTFKTTATQEIGNKILKNYTT